MLQREDGAFEISLVIPQYPVGGGETHCMTAARRRLKRR